MVFAIIGGDLRSAYLARRLQEDGHRVLCYGVTGVPDTQGEAVDAVVLPTPVLKGQCLNGMAEVTAETLAAALPTHCPVFGGGISPPLWALCRDGGVDFRDLLSDEAFWVGNAALTARAAVELLGEAVEGRVLVLGGGRIGRLLGLYLARRGTQVTVAARSSTQRAWCRAMGAAAVDIGALDGLLPQYDALVNTVPARVLDNGQLERLPKEAILLELASAPGGFDAPPRELVHGGGLPGRYFPKEAADLMAERIYEELGD